MGDSQSIHTFPFDILAQVPLNQLPNALAYVHLLCKHNNGTCTYTEDRHEMMYHLTIDKEEVSAVKCVLK